MNFDAEYSSLTYFHSKRRLHLGRGRDYEDVEASEDFISLQSKTQAMGLGDTNNVHSIASLNVELNYNRLHL